MAKKRKKRSPRAIATSKLDSVFSKYVRQKYANKRNWVACYTCGKKKRVKDMQCGHYKSRKYIKYRRNEDNCRPQCYRCNVLLKGNYKSYTLRLVQELGFDKVSYIENDDKPHKISTAKINEMIEYYNNLI